MRTLKTLLRVMKMQRAYGDSGPHSIIGPPPMDRPARRPSPVECPRCDGKEVCYGEFRWDCPLFNRPSK